MMLAHDIKLLLFLLLSLHGCDNIWISSSQLHLGKKHNACWPRYKDVACNETNLMLHTCHPWTLLQLPVGGGWCMVCGLQDSLPQVRQVKCCVKISSGQTPRQVHKSGLSSGLGKGSLYSQWGGLGYGFSFGFSFALRFSVLESHYVRSIINSESQLECGRHYRQTQTV